MFNRLLAAGALLVCLSAPATAQQVADTGYAPTLDSPAYIERGPHVVVDGAHRNFHTLDGRYAPFGKLLEADGYSVSALTTPLSTEALAEVNILVIANAQSATPGTSAFTSEEIEATHDWVEAGGSLLLVADHAPFGGAAADLARAFGVDMGLGYVAAHQDGKVTFAIDYAGPQLGDHPILHGRSEKEEVRQVRSFTGQSLGVPDGGVGLLALPADALEIATPIEAGALLKGENAPGNAVGGSSGAGDGGRQGQGSSRRRGRHVLGAAGVAPGPAGTAYGPDDRRRSAIRAEYTALAVAPDRLRLSHRAGSDNGRSTGA